jgi:hypothetical protein
MITKEEFYELDAIRRAIKDNPASVHPDKMERFTELFVKSIKEKSCDVTLQRNWQNLLVVVNTLVRVKIRVCLLFRLRRNKLKITMIFWKSMVNCL